VPRIAVAGPSGVVTDAAVEVGEQGGSVVDVAIVAALTAMCTEPGVCGPGGGGYLTIDVPGRPSVVIDGYMSVPGSGHRGEADLREVTMPYGGGVTTLVGAGSVAVPGAFAALEMAADMFGEVPWSVLMGVVAGSVEKGFPLSRACHLYLNDGADQIFRADPEVEAALFDGDRCRPLGASIVFPGLAETLRWIGEEGTAVFYRGDLGRAIVDDLSSRGGQLTMEDMRSYRAVPRSPLPCDLKGWHLSLNPEPAIGGLTVADALGRVVEGTPAEMAGALTAAFRSRYERGLRSPSTIAVATADEEGGAVAASFSAGYGSGLAPAGTGMLMNNAVGELELVSAGTRPGTRMLSNMAPTVARHGAEAVAVGSPGADRITSAIVTTLARLALGDSMEQAIDHPRVHPEFGVHGVRLAAEPGLDLEGVGVAVRHFDGPHMFFGGVNGAGFIGGEIHAYADARRTGSVGFTTGSEFDRPGGMM
jgi:gamma-glutamyltranspeptidase/glutathione hydrolase